MGWVELGYEKWTHVHLCLQEKLLKMTYLNFVSLFLVQMILNVTYAIVLNVSLLLCIFSFISAHYYNPIILLHYSNGRLSQSCELFDTDHIFAYSGTTLCATCFEQINKLFNYM